MRKELLNQRPTSALRGQSPLCESVGTGHTSTHPSIFTKVLLVLLTMLLLPSTAWADYTYGSGEELSFDYDGSKRYFWSSNGTIWKASMSGGDDNSWPRVTNYETTPVTVSPFTNFDALKLTLQSKLKGTLTGFALSGTVTSEAHVNIKVYRLTAKDATTGTEIGSIAITGGATPTYTYTATTTNGVTQEFNNEYIQLAFEHTGGDASSIAYDAITGITLTFSGTSYDLSVDDCRVTSNNATDILGDSKVSFSSNTLTLSEGASLTNITYSGSEDLTIAFSGTVTINGEQSGSACIKATKPSKLIFTSSNGSLVLQGNGEYGVIQDFSDVNFGILNLASSQSPGLYYNWDDNKECGTMTDYNGSSVTNMTITTATTFYPIWVMNRQGTPAHTQLTSETSSVDMVRKIGGEDGEDVVICTVSYDATNGKLIIEANEEAENNDYAFQPGSSNAAIVVGSSLEELTVHLVGDTKITDEGSYIFSAWNTTSLTFTTTESTPGSLTGSDIFSWKGGNGQVTYLNGLVFNYESSPYRETISTTGVRIKIGKSGDPEVIFGSTDENGLFGGTVFFDASNNTLTLKGATLGNIDSPYGIQVFVDDLKVIISDDNTILGDITYAGNSSQSSSIQINKAEGATSVSLTMPSIEQFGACALGEGLYLSAIDYEGKSVDVGYEFEEGEGGFRSYYGEIAEVTISTTPSYPLWINGIQATEGNVTGTGIEKNGEDVSESEWGITFTPATNTLLLQNVLLTTTQDHTPAIISGLDNLKIQIEGDNFISNTGSYGGYTALSTKSSAGLTITTENNGQLVTNYGSSSYQANPFHGFQSVTFDRDLIYIAGSGSQFIQNLGVPVISLSSGNKLTLSSPHDDYGSNYVSYYYTLDFADSDENDISTPTILSEEVPTISKACSVTAYISYEYKGNEYHDYEYGTLKKTGEDNPAIGKYFKVADKTIVFNNTTNELKASDLELSPDTKNEGVSIQSIENAYNSDVISHNEGSDKYSIAGIGSCNVEVNLSVADNASIQVLNRDGEVIRAIGEVTVVPDKPTIVKDTNHDYLNTDKITISVDGEDLPIFYTWSDDVEVKTYQYIAEGGSVSIYDPNEKITAQTGTLRAWVGYSAGDNYYYNSKVVSETFTVKTDISNFNVRNKGATAAFEPTATYTGAAIVPEFTVVDEKGTTLASTNYIVSYQSVEIVAGDGASGPSTNYTDVGQMVEVGSYRIVITGTGDNYGGTKTVDFAINKANLGIVTIESIADQTYTGSAITLEEVTVTLNGEQVSSDEYEITYSNNTNVSTEAEKASVTITATASSIHFTQGTTQTAPFNITPKSIEGVTVTLSGDGFDSEKNSFVYNGQNQKPTVTVKDGETLLTQNKDYTLTNEGGIIAGEYPVTVTGMGNYNKTTTATFTISKGVGVLNAPEPIGDLIYTGDPQTLITEAKPVNTTGVVRYSLDYSLSTDQWSTELPKGTNAGNYNIYYMVEGDDNYSGVDKKEDAYITATINQADLAGAAISKIAFGGKEYTVGDLIEIPYTGEAIQPTVEEVTFNDGTVTVDASDYNVSYSNNTEISSDDNLALIIITSTGKNFTEGTSTSQGFKIVRATVTITAENQTVTYNADKQEYDISKIEVSNNNAKLAITYYAKEADRSNGENALAEAPTNADTYYVRVTLNEESQQHYVADPADATFTIDQLELTNAGITLDNTELTYNNGETLTVNVTKVMAGDIEVPVDCYEVSGNTEKEAGDYKLTVTAKTKDSQGNAIKNNFTGSAEKDWKIKNRTVTADELGLSENQPQATYYSNTEDLEVPDGVVANIITGVSDGKATTQRISYIPKNVPVFVELTTSSEEPIEIPKDPSQLPLKGTAEPKDVADISGGTVFVLYKGEFVKSTTGTIPAHRCYLLLPNDVAAGTRAFGIIRGVGGSNGSTAIKSIEIDNAPSTVDNWYDMRGRRIEKPTKTGIYIKDGKKVVINNK